tara:strand:- start:6082 stop:6339 length:258 start_codon:yes stop_codon:yes gene_type:complete
MSKTHLRGNTVEYSWKEYYGDGNKVWHDVIGFKKLCEYMQTRSAEYMASADASIRFTVSRNGQELHWTRPELLELLTAAQRDSRE